MEGKRKGRNGGWLNTGGNFSPGRPKKIPELDILLAEVLGEETDGLTAAIQILQALKKKAIKGDVRAAEVLLDRAYGKAKAEVDLMLKDKAITAVEVTIIAPKVPENGKT